MPLDIALGSMLFLSFAQRLRERFEGLYTERSESIGTSEQAFEENGVGINHFAAAGGNILNIEAVTELKITELMMWLMFEKEKTEIELKKKKRNGI